MPKPIPEQLNTIDQINHVLCLVNAARMATTADEVPIDIADPLGTLLNVIRDKLSACVDGLEGPATA